MHRPDRRAKAPTPNPKPVCGGRGGCFTQPGGEVLEERRCPCGYGYVNREGTVIPGSLVRRGHVLQGGQYNAHKDCKICLSHPDKCPQRKRYLSENAEKFGLRRSSALASQLEYYEFFVAKPGIKESILRAFLDHNTNDNSWAFSRIEFQVSRQLSTVLYLPLTCRISARRAISSKAGSASHCKISGTCKDLVRCAMKSENHGTPAYHAHRKSLSQNLRPS